MHLVAFLLASSSDCPLRSLQRCLELSSASPSLRFSPLPNHELDVASDLLHLSPCACFSHPRLRASYVERRLGLRFHLRLLCFGVSDFPTLCCLSDLPFILKLISQLKDLDFDLSFSFVLQYVWVRFALAVFWNVFWIWSYSVSWF